MKVYVFQKQRKGKKNEDIEKFTEDFYPLKQKWNRQQETI